MKIKGFFSGRSLREKRKLTVIAVTVSLEFRNRSNKTSKPPFEAEITSIL